MRTLEFKAQPINAFFATVNQMFGGFSQLPTTAEHVVLKSLSTIQTTEQCSAVVGSWEEPRNIWLTAAKNVFGRSSFQFWSPHVIESGSNLFCLTAIMLSDMQVFMLVSLFRSDQSTLNLFTVANSYYYPSDSLWKIWLVESIQSIHNSLWTWHDKCNICCRYCIYHVQFNVCPVTKPLGAFSSETKWLNASLLFLRMNYVKNV